MKRWHSAILCLSGLAGLIAVAAASQAAPAELRFHHLHLRTTDPAMAMNDVAARAGGTRVILQGLGVGVRIGEHYILFERGEPSRAPGAAGASAAYEAAGRWLKARQFDVMPLELSATRVPAARPEGAVDHVAFATADLDAAVAALQRTGAEPVRRSSESAFFAAGDGIVVEVTRDNDRPDAFWCPMRRKEGPGVPWGDDSF